MIRKYYLKLAPNSSTFSSLPYYENLLRLVYEALIPSKIYFAPNNEAFFNAQYSPAWCLDTFFAVYGKIPKTLFGSPREIFYSFFYNFNLNFRKSLNKKFKLFLFTIVIIYIIILLGF